MATHVFSLILSGGVELTDDVAEEVYLKVGDDTLLGKCNTAAFIDFERESESFTESVLGAIEAVEAIGLRVEHVEPDDYVTAAEIARRIGRTRENVRQFIAGERGPGDLPPPVSNVGERSPRWRWSDVAPWLVAQGMLAEEKAEEATFLALVNTWLEWRRLGRPGFAAGIRSSLFQAL